MLMGAGFFHVAEVRSGERVRYRLVPHAIGVYGLTGESDAIRSFWLALGRSGIFASSLSRGWAYRAWATKTVSVRAEAVAKGIDRERSERAADVDANDISVM